MPVMTNDSAMGQNQLAKLLLIGDGKIGKTHYTGMAAEAGLNLLYMDGDVASQTLATLPMTAKQNIYLMQVADSMVGGTPNPNFIRTALDMVSSTNYMWNDTQRRKYKATDDDSADEIWQLKLAAMDHNTVWVIDSWTSLTESIMLQAAQAHGVDLADASQPQMRPVYSSAGMKATQILRMIRAARCHVIVIAHPDEYSHQTKPEGRRVKDIKETDMVVDWTKMIPKSTSKPHGLLLPKYFTDVAWAQTNRAGTEFQLNFKLKEDRVSGGHFKEAKSQEEYSFANLIKQIGGTLPTEPQPTDSWLTIYPSGEAIPKPESKVLDGTKATEVKSKGFSGLMKK